MSASWYDVLGVEPEATAEQIREAWSEAIAGLDPTHKRFRLYNEAAAVLLDDDARAEYDASLALEQAAVGDSADRPYTDEPDDADEPDEPDEPDDADEPDNSAAPDESDDSGATSKLPLVPIWLILGLALATAVVATVAFLHQRDQSKTRAEADAVAEAVSAARDSAPKVLSYSAQTADQDRASALKVLTGDLKCEYDTLWKQRLSPLLKGSRAFAKTTVATAGVAGVTEDGERVRVLLVLDTESGSARTTQQMVTLSFTATMVEKKGEWLIEKFDGWDPEAVAQPSGKPSGQSSAQPSAPSSALSSGSSSKAGAC